MILSCRLYLLLSLNFEICILLIMETFKQQISKNLPENLKKDELVAAILSLQISRPENWNWKEDYATALEEKYDALDELLTKTIPKVGANGTGFISKQQDTHNLSH